MVCDHICHGQYLLSNKKCKHFVKIMGFEVLNVYCLADSHDKG